jgi:tetratricopeptide (TPR) repeat protein
MRLSLPWPVLLGFLSSCHSQPFGEIDRATSSAQLDQAEADVSAGNYARALERLAEVHELEGLEPDVRVREERLIDDAARGRFAQMADAPADDLMELFDSKLPERVRARAGIMAADRMLAEGRRITAFRQVKKVDEKIPGHPERVLAGDVVARAGLSLIEDDGRYNLLFHYRPRGVQALEYLVVHYPLEPRCPQAYFELSEVYERDGDFDQAIDRSEELLLYHPESPYAPAASARLPYLRLCRLGRDDYDRGELLRARAELAAWLERYPGHELAGWVGDLVRECQTRLVRSDLYLAGYYERTRTPAGQRLHAERARALAQEAGLEDEVAAAERLLAPLERGAGPGTAPEAAPLARP